MPKILVTGGLGYIGSHTVVELLDKGYEVVIVDDLSNSERFVLDRIQQITDKKPSFYEFNLTKQSQLDALFSKEKLDGVIHFAAHKAVFESVKFPIKYYRNNILTLLNVLEACEKHQVKNLIFSSSCVVYGQAEKLPIDESAPLKPAESPYGATKQMGEEILKDQAHATEQKVISLRYFNPIGAHPSGLIGELPKGVPDNLIPYVTQTAAGLRECLSVFGDDYPTTDGTAIRDYIYVVDLAQAHVLAMHRLLQDQQDAQYEVYNLGTGKGSTVMEVVNAFEQVNNIKLNYKIAPRRAGDIVAAYADNQNAKTYLGWEPTTPLEEALRTAWEWQKSLNLQ